MSSTVKPESVDATIYARMVAPDGPRSGSVRISGSLASMAPIELKPTSGEPVTLHPGTDEHAAAQIFLAAAALLHETFPVIVWPAEDAA